MIMTAWSEDYLIGVELIDNQHMDIMEKIEELASTDSPKLVAEVLLKYVGKHFDDEERIMRNIGYLGYHKHRRIHSSFRDRVVLMILRLDEPGMVDELVRYASSWIVNHIAHEDLLVGAAVREFTDSVFEGIDIDPKYLGE